MVEEVFVPESDQAADGDDIIVALRTAHQHQVQLNVLADQKANIVLGFTLFFITLTQSQFSMAAGGSDFLRYGFVLLTLMIATSLLLALIVVLPRTGHARITRPEEMSNPIYFGMFSQLQQSDYVSYLEHKISGNAEARRVVMVDIFQIGLVLRRKYRLLRLSYGFLAISVVIAVLLYCYKILVA